jgi:hypothetical protein
LNPNIITVNAALPHEKFGGSLYNPGAYLSLDGGQTWQKINTRYCPKKVCKINFYYF